MVQCGFLFDFVVVRIDVPNKAIEEQDMLAVDATFNNVALRITPSRINVVEFKPRRSFEFESTPEDLKRELSESPLRLKVFYGSEAIGTATVPWNECVLGRIASDMGEMTHIDESDLYNDAEERVGSIEYICRLQCKCEEPSDEFCAPNATSDIKNHINKIIDPNDVLFVVVEPNKEDVCNVAMNDPCDSSCDAPRPTTALDLSPYRVLNGRLVQNADAVNTCQNSDCCDILKTSQQYQQLIDALNPCPKKKKSSNRMCQAHSHCKECPHENKFSSHSDSESESSMDYQQACPDARLSGRGNANVNTCEADLDLPDDTETVFKRPRNCPICKEDIRWLPKLAACPKCCYKPVPVYIEKPHNEELTAEKILEDYLQNRPSDSDSDIPRRNCGKKSPRCRCTCVKGKVCPNCRVRKMCGDMLETQADEEETCGKCEEDAIEQYRLCTSSSQDCRPHLARVFSELKDLFDASASKRGSETRNEKCENELNPPSSAKKRQASLRQTGGKPQDSGQFKDLLPCECKKEQKKRKRFRKRRVQKALCRPQACEQEELSREELLQKFHDACIDHRRNVPSNMGWLWSANTELGPNWRPGAIRKPVKEIMRYFLRDFPADTIPISRYTYRRTNGNGNGKGDHKAEEEEELVQLPTLHICKKNGEIFITLRPLKNPEALKNCANPYMDMKPIKFKIIKNPLAAEIGKMKQCLKDMGFSKCTCQKPIVECFCRTFLDKKRLEYQLKKECRKRGLEDFCESLRLSDSEDSEVEYDFSVTPPAGLIRRDLLKRPDKVNVGTQYEQCDWNPPISQPLPPNTFMKWINCATGYKYAYRRASDLLTLGQKEAALCAQRKAEEPKKGKKGKGGKGKGGKGKKGDGDAGGNEEGGQNFIQKCPDGTKVNMRKYLDPKAKK